MNQKRFKKPPALRLSRELRRIEVMLAKPKKKHSYGALFKAMSLRSNALPALIFALPFVPPMPLPGFSLFGGSIIAIVGFRTALGKGPWLPSSIRRRKIPTKFFLKTFKIVEWSASKLEFLIKPRGQFLYHFKATNLVIGFIIGVCGLIIANPLLPPGTSTPPALTVVLLSLGLLEQDGVLVILGYIGFLLNLIFFALLIWAFFEVRV